MPAPITVVYDAVSRLTTVDVAGGIVTCTYDGARRS
jgi:YD repeat-containing protein